MQKTDYFRHFDVSFSCTLPCISASDIFRFFLLVDCPCIFCVSICSRWWGWQACRRIDVKLLRQNFIKLLLDWDRTPTFTRAFVMILYVLKCQFQWFSLISYLTVIGSHSDLYLRQYATSLNMFYISTLPLLTSSISLKNVYCFICPVNTCSGTVQFWRTSRLHTVIFPPKNWKNSLE